MLRKLFMSQRRPIPYIYQVISRRPSTKKPTLLQIFTCYRGLDEQYQCWVAEKLGTLLSIAQLLLIA